jgi:hypothetical protein
MGLRGRLLVAALSTIFLTTSLCAQRRRMGGHAGFVGFRKTFASVLIREVTRGLFRQFAQPFQ